MTKYSYIKRIHHTPLVTYLTSEIPKGIIVSGIVGAGKTTLVTETLKELKKTYQIFKFSGDDIKFRKRVAEDSQYIFDYVTSMTTRAALVFVDEVQKTEAVFDALKYAFDQGGISFVVSGSNPHYLSTVAKKRLQRRAEILQLPPLSLPEILASKGFIQISDITSIHEMFRNSSLLPEYPSFKFTVEDIRSELDTYLLYGGLPLSYHRKAEDDKLREIQLVVERGFEALYSDGDNVSDIIRIAVAERHSKEFAYKGIMQSTGIRKRDTINQVVEELIRHGYLRKKKPVILEGGRRSYLSIYSYCDPGIVSYLSSEVTLDPTLGPRVEGVVHNRLSDIQARIPLKSQLGYYKPYSIDRGNKLKFLQGEIDFLFSLGKKILPIEVKAGVIGARMDLKTLKQFIKKQNLPFGVIFYAGMPNYKENEKLLFWPYWLL